MRRSPLAFASLLILLACSDGRALGPLGRCRGVGRSAVDFLCWRKTSIPVTTSLDNDKGPEERLVVEAVTA